MYGASVSATMALLESIAQLPRIVALLLAAVPTMDLVERTDCAAVNRAGLAMIAPWPLIVPMTVLAMVTVLTILRACAIWGIRALHAR